MSKILACWDEGRQQKDCVPPHSLDESSMPTIDGGGRRGNCTAYRTWLLCSLGRQTLNAGQLMHLHPVPMAMNSPQHLKVRFNDAEPLRQCLEQR